MSLQIHNGDRVAYSSIPVASNYEAFLGSVRSLLGRPDAHCVNYFALAENDALRLICCIALDESHLIDISSCCVSSGASLPSSRIIALERFEREMAENFSLVFEGHPWPKPVRTASDDYPFYHADSEELHEVGVGPIHAGVIEPGHFRFICDGEKILHLEIMLGYQHRGLEKLMVERPLEQKELLAESIAGDTAVGHSTAFALVWESLSDFSPSDETQFARTLATELERIAIHTGDLSAICGDVAYQLGSAVFGRLRTPIINFMQKWCGNRLGKSLVRPFGNPYPMTLIPELLDTLNAFEKDFEQMSLKIRRFPSVLSRLEKTGTVTFEQASEIGAVGMAAKASGLNRDIRASHPYYDYAALAHMPIVKHHGDVYSRTQIRIEEVRQSIAHIRRLCEQWQGLSAGRNGLSENDGYAEMLALEKTLTPACDQFAIALTEGWRGEICHCAITGSDGSLRAYKVCDPSFHNWMALALAVRGNGISDFPICNKSFNLSYCGHDL